MAREDEMADEEKKPRPQMSADAPGSSGHGAKLEAVRKRAVVALLSERSIGAAADRCGVNEKTLRRWMTDDEAFKAELTEARRALFQAGMNRVQALAAEAVETLAALMAPDVSPAVRLGAARMVAEIALQQHDAEVIVQRLEQIEALQRQREARR
jgi:hypothetical protein